MLAGRLPLEHLRAHEGRRARHRRRRTGPALGETGVFALTLPEPAGTGLGHGRRGRRLRRAGPGTRPGSARRHVPGRGAPAWSTGAADGRGAGRRAHCAATRARPGGASGRRSTRCSSSDEPTARPSCCPRRPAAAPRQMAHPLDPLTPLWRLDALPFGGAVAGDDGRLLARRRAAHGGAAGRPRGRRARPGRGLRQGAPAVRQAHRVASRRSSTCAPTCWCGPRWPAPRCTPRPAWPTRPTSRRRRPRRRGARRGQLLVRSVVGRQAAGRRGGARSTPGPPSRSTAAWGSPGRCRCTSTSSGRVCSSTTFGPPAERAPRSSAYA